MIHLLGTLVCAVVGEGADTEHRRNHGFVATVVSPTGIDYLARSVSPACVRP